LRCPKCDNTVLMRRSFSPKRSVTVDECPSCGGYWLGPGELRQIRSEYPSDEARDQAGAQLFDEVFGDSVAAERAEDTEETARAHRVAKMFRFICPSNYIPGKQDGGAF
jgi:Zn-finger nucleic acid-binding protein